MTSFLTDTDRFGQVSEFEPLAPLTKYRLGGPARWFIRPRSSDELRDLLGRCRHADVPLRILGGGANLLVGDDGVDGVVIRLDAPCFRRVDWNGAAAGSSRALLGEPPQVMVTVGAGVDMVRLVLQSVQRGLAGLEGLAGIPGSMGGIIRMNAGGRWGQISDVVVDVTVVEPYGAVRTLTREEIGFGYRRTRLNGAVVCEARLALRPDDPEKLKDRYQDVWSSKNDSQPLAAHSAGCVFKNPAGDSAGRLIDRAGLKGASVGSARVSNDHANFIVADTGGTAGDVLALIDLVRQTVADRFGVELELEIEVWDRQPALVL